MTIKELFIARIMDSFVRLNELPESLDPQIIY